MNQRTTNGFTLMELMIAIGILGIGMTMAAALFPAGVKEANTAISSGIGQTICENGLAIARTLPPPTSSYTYFVHSASEGLRIDETATDILDKGAQHYPYSSDPESKSRYGFALLLRQPDTDQPAYQIACAAYQKSDEDNDVSWQVAEATYATVNSDGKTVLTYRVASGRVVPKKGTPMVCRNSGQWGYVTHVNEDTQKVTLDRDIGLGTKNQASLKAENNHILFVLEEANRDDDLSPAIYTMVVTSAMGG